MDIEQKRRELFEKVCKGSLPKKGCDFSIDQSGKYYESGIDWAWWGFQAALDSIEIELTEFDRKSPFSPEEVVKFCKEDIESLGLGVKVK